MGKADVNTQRPLDTNSQKAESAEEEILHESCPIQGLIGVGM